VYEKRGVVGTRCDLKVAILVLAYRASACLRAAIPLYCEAGFDVYVHLDSKASLLEYRNNLGEQGRNCRFIGTRFPIYWAGFNMVRAEMALLREALAYAYTKYVLISDDTFPLVGPTALNAFFADDLNRIDLRQIGPDDPFFARYAQFYMLDHNATSLLGRQIELSCIDSVLLEKIDEIRGLRAIGKASISLYYGSQWWALAYDAAATVLHRFDHDRHVMKSFEFSAVPDEIFVQSVIGNDFTFVGRLRGSCVYVEWARTPRPYVYESLDDLTNIRDDAVLLRKIADDPAVIEMMSLRARQTSKPL
jgi:hypothetical protein